MRFVRPQIRTQYLSPGLVATISLNQPSCGSSGATGNDASRVSVAEAAKVSSEGTYWYVTVEPATVASWRLGL